MVLVLLTAACAAPTPGAPASSPASGPRSGGALNLQIRSDPFNWDQTQSRTSPNDAGAALAYDTLVGYKTGPDVPYNESVLVPALAESWEASADAKTFTFHLRKGVKYAMSPKVEGLNGRELTSNDVKFSYEYGSRTGEFNSLPASEYGFMFEGLDRVDAPDPYTVVVCFKEPFAPFINFAGASWNSIVAPEIYRQDGSLKDRILGTGAFQLDLDASQKGTRWVWKKNPDYWQQGKPHIDQVRQLVLVDPAAQHAAFIAKQVDVLESNVSLKDAEELKKSAPDATYFDYETGHPWAFYINQTRPPFDDERVRRAYSLSIDRDEMIQTFTRGRGHPQLPAAFTGNFTVEEVRKMQPYDPAQAKKLLAEAGYPNGVDFEITYPGQAYGDDYVSMLQLMQAQVKKGGLNINLKTLDPQTFSANLRPRNHTVSIQVGSSRRWDIDLSFTDWHSNSRVNYHGVNDPKLTATLDFQRAQGDPKKRLEAIRAAVSYIVEKQYGIGLFSQVRNIVWQPYLKNFGPNWNIVSAPVIDSWLEK
jgi:peptide/nickel transport system substrate-binding protein